MCNIILIINVNIILILVEFLADKFRASVFDRTKDGSTLMHIAALNGHPETAMVLFKKGVPLLMPNKSGARGIHTAAAKGHVAVVNSLLTKGENVDAATNVMTNVVILNIDMTSFITKTVQKKYVGQLHCSSSSR